MPLSFFIFPDDGLCAVRYSGVMRMEESAAVFAQYVRHPDYRPGQKQLIDLDDVTAMDTDFVGLMKLQAEKAGHMHGPELQTLIAYLATRPKTQKFARLIQRSWDGIDGVVARVMTDEAEALDFLGLPADRIGLLTAMRRPARD